MAQASSNISAQSDGATASTRGPVKESARPFGVWEVLRWMPWGRAELIIGTTAINVLAIALPLVILQTYDRIIPNESRDSLLLLVGGVAVAFLLDAVLRVSRADMIGRAGARFVHFMKCVAVSRLLNGRLDQVEETEPGTQLERLSAIDTLRDFHTGQVMVQVLDLPFVAIFLGLIAYIAGWLVLVPIVLFTAFIFAALLLGRALRKEVEKRSQQEGSRHAFIVEVLSGIHSIKAIGMEALMNRRYERLLGANSATTLNTLRLSARGHELAAMISQLCVILVAIAGSVMVINQNLTIGGLVACTLLAGRALQPLLKVLNFWSQVQSLRVAADQTARVFDIEPRSKANEGRKTALKGAIRAEKVSYRYTETGPPVLSKIDFEAEPGQIVGIRGETGGGKTTLLDILSGHLHPTAGRLTFDGVDATVIDAANLHAQIAQVPQVASVFRGSLLDNLTGFRGAAAADLAMQYAADLGLDDKIALLPDGLDSELGDSSADTLPPGMRQQISVVRSLVTRPKILLLDESNSNMDAHDDELLGQLLQSLSGEMTIIMVSHRPSTLALASRIYELKAGQLTDRTPEIGTAGVSKGAAA